MRQFQFGTLRLNLRLFDCRSAFRSFAACRVHEITLFSTLVVRIFNIYPLTIHILTKTFLKLSVTLTRIAVEHFYYTMLYPLQCNWDPRLETRLLRYKRLTGGLIFSGTLRLPVATTSLLSLTPFLAVCRVGRTRKAFTAAGTFFGYKQ